MNFLARNNASRSSLDASRSEIGFTLIEVVISVGIFALSAGLIVVLISNILGATSKQQTQLADVDSARKLAFGIVSELRRSQQSLTGSYALQVAQPQQIIFFSNVDSDANPERVRYFSSSTSLYLGIVKATGTTPSYNVASETLSIVQRNLGNGTSTPIFTFYDGSYVGSSTQAALTQPVEVTDVKFVKVTLKVLNRIGFSTTTTVTVSNGGAIRSLKTNLGN